MNKPHDLVRHPDMPKSIFKLWWDHLKEGKEVFAYVNSRAKNGDNYWVQAHGTPSYNKQDRLVGYHSNRRAPDRKILENIIIPLYADLKSIEDETPGSKGVEAAYQKIQNLLKEEEKTYNEWFFSIS